MNVVDLYHSLYRLASSNAENALFGTSAQLAHEAFQRSLVGEVMPIIWFEIPLSASPRFDLHVAYDNADLHREAPFSLSAADHHGALLNWYAAQPREGGGLSLAYDVGDGRIDTPAVHANVNGAAGFDEEGFFAHVDRPDASELYDGFVGRLPKGWRVWYFGIHPGRPGAPVRVDCSVEDELKLAYAADPAKLSEDLRRVGVAEISACLLDIGTEIAESSCGLELQFDVLTGGTLGQTVSLSASLPIAPASRVRPSWGPNGSAAHLMEFAEMLCIADSRWHHIADTLLTTAVEEDGKMLALYCIPVFAKFRVRAGEPVDAKVYLQAGARSLDGRFA